MTNLRITCEVMKINNVENFTVENFLIYGIYVVYMFIARELYTYEVTNMIVYHEPC